MKEFSMVVVLDDFSVAESAGMKVARMVDWKVWVYGCEDG